MKWLPLLFLAGCATPTWVVPQPQFTTKDPDEALARITRAVAEHCGGVRNVNEEAGVVVSPWTGWNTGTGLVLTSCMVTLLSGDKQVRDVRITFSVRNCPLSDMSDLEAIAPTCERTDTVNEKLRRDLERVGEQLQAQISPR